MRNNSFIFILLILCIGLVCGLTMWFGYSSQDQMWRLDDTYSQELATWRASSQFTSATYSSSYSNDGLAVSMPSRSFRSARAHVPSYAYAPTTPASSSSSLVSNGASPAGGGLYTTSSAAMRSFGDGSSSSMGSSRSSAGGGAAAAGGVYTSMPSAGSSSWGGGGSSSSSGAYASSIVMSSAQSANPANAIAMGSSAGSNSLYSGFAYTSMLDQYQMASYGNSGASRVTNKKNDGGPGGSNGSNGDTYSDWLNWWYKYGVEGEHYNKEYSYQNEDGSWVYVFLYDDVVDAYIAWFVNRYGTTPENYTGAAPEITLEQWIEIFKGKDGNLHQYNNNTWFCLPIGDSWTLLFMAILYACYVLFRHYRKRIATSLEK